MANGTKMSRICQDFVKILSRNVFFLFKNLECGERNECLHIGGETGSTLLKPFTKGVGLIFLLTPGQRPST